MHKISMKIVVDEKLDTEISRLEEIMECDRTSLFKKAMVLIKIAVDSYNKGHHLVTVDEQGNIIEEIINVVKVN